MRLGNILIGFLLAIAIAYVHDVAVERLAVDGHPQTIVNWDVFGAVASDVGDWLRVQASHLADLINRR